MTITHKRDGDEVIYPESDGEPMADNTRQFSYIGALKNGFDALYIDDADVFVAGDLLWYPVCGNNKIRYAPDVLIALGRPKGHRGSYLQWEENNQPPNVVFEVLSPCNTRPEMQKKLKAYDRYKVDEYYEYDPDRGILKGWIRDSTTDKLEEVANMDRWQSPLTKVTMHLNGKDLIVTRPDGSIFLNSEESAIEIRSIRKAREQALADKEHERAEKEQALADKEHERVEKEQALAAISVLAEKLKTLGIDPDSL